MQDITSITRASQRTTENLVDRKECTMLGNSDKMNLINSTSTKESIKCGEKDGYAKVSDQSYDICQIFANQLEVNDIDIKMNAESLKNTSHSQNLKSNLLESHL